MPARLLRLGMWPSNITDIRVLPVQTFTSPARSRLTRHRFAFPPPPYPTQGIREEFEASTGPWKAIFDSVTPHSETLPGRWSKLITLERMCILRCLRPDKMVPAVQNFVSGRWAAAVVGERVLRPGWIEWCM